MKIIKIIFVVSTFFLSLWLAYGITSKFFAKNQNPFQTTISSKLTALKDGDIIFQTSQSSQCEAVKIATKSKFSHCGIIFIIDNKPMVLEAVQPVKITDFDKWISHGKNNEYTVKRLIDSGPIAAFSTIVKMQEYGKSMLDKDYDLYFGWEDDKIYCSELVWKIYKQGADIELCPLQKLSSFDLNHPKVKKILSERYGNKIPTNQTVVSPESIEKSNLLHTIIDTYQ